MSLRRPATFSGSEFSLPYNFETFISKAQPPYFMDDHGDHRLNLIPPLTLDVNNLSGGDPSSMSYLPRAARSAPRAHIVHTIHVKKITPCRRALTNCGSSKSTKMASKRGAPLNLSWPYRRSSDPSNSCEPMAYPLRYSTLPNYLPNRTGKAIWSKIGNSIFFTLIKIICVS
jgi:hypothetical protein